MVVTASLTTCRSPSCQFQAHNCATRCIGRADRNIGLSQFPRRARHLNLLHLILTMAISSALGVILALNAALLFGFSSHVLVWAARVPAQVDTFNSVPPIDACSTHTRIGSIAPPSNAPQGSGAREPSNTTAPSGSPVRGRPRPAAAVNVTSEPLHFPEGGACLSRAINGTSPRPSTYWVQDIKRRGKAPFNASPETYTVYRNVKDFGARGTMTERPQRLRFDLMRSRRWTF